MSVNVSFSTAQGKSNNLDKLKRKLSNEVKFDLTGYRGPGSSVGITTDYGLDGPGIESRWGGGEIFRPSRSALGPT